VKKGLRLWGVLTVVFTIVLLLVTSILYGLVLIQNSSFIRSNEEQLLLSVGKQLAIDPQVTSALEEGKTNAELEAYTKEVTQIHGLDFVVVMNMQAIRLTHPDESQIGKHFEGGDEVTALEGKEHTSISEGTLGRSLRGFVPVYSLTEPKKQIGVVALGIRMQSLSALIKSSREGYLIALILSITIAACAATGLAYYLKRQLHNLEPKEISRLFEERNAMLEETKDAVIVLDLNQQINLANIAANELYQKNSGRTDSLVGKHLQDLVLQTETIDLERNVEQLYRQNGQDFLFSSAPIIVEQKRIGWIVFLRNATESLFVMDQLANTTAYATALQSQSHEFMNKLHVIYGLADLKAYDELKIYLDDILTPEKEFSHRLSFLVQNPQIAGFLIGERQKFSERKIQLLIEISPEIPANPQEAETKALIDLYRYIHHILLQMQAIEELRIEIQYAIDQLTSTYTIQLSEANQQVQDSFRSNYFQQMLKDYQALFSIEEQPNLVILQIQTHYHGVIK
jgi:two-component system CitB family sensor kinase